MSWKKFTIVNAVLFAAHKAIMKYADNVVETNGIDKTYTVDLDGFDQDLDDNDKKVLAAMIASITASCTFVLYNIAVGMRSVMKKNWLLAVVAFAIPFMRSDVKINHNDDYSELSVDVDKDTFISDN